MQLFIPTNNVKTRYNDERGKDMEDTQEAKKAKVFGRKLIRKMK